MRPMGMSSDNLLVRAEHLILDLCASASSFIAAFLAARFSRFAFASSMSPPSSSSFAADLDARLSSPFRPAARVVPASHSLCTPASLAASAPSSPALAPIAWRNLTHNGASRRWQWCSSARCDRLYARGALLVSVRTCRTESISSS